MRRALHLTSGKQNGGLGGGLVEAQAIVSEVARGEPSTALVLVMHYSHHHAISRGGKWPAHLIERVSKANLQGPALINSAQVEPRVGSPSHGTLPETIARREGDVWRITGHKTYATGIAILKWVSVLAVTDEPEPRLASFLVPTDAPGLHIVETWNATGMRATASHDIILDNVAVPLADIIDPRPAGEGLKRDEQGMAWYFLLIASVYQGVARAAGNWITRFAASYAPGSLGAPIATVPRILAGLGDIETRLATNDRLLTTAAADADAARPLGVQSAMTKSVVIENAVNITSIALDLGGNPGLKRDHPLERHHRDALCSRSHAPQNNLIHTMAAKAALARHAVATPVATSPAVEKPSAQPLKLTIVH
jgi:alkylation response protein AidB-like acyl-CoA dehydrogenase